MELKRLYISDIQPDMLNNFNRYHRIGRRWRKNGNDWELEDVSFARQWDDDKKKWIVSEYFPTLLNRGGVLTGAYEENNLIGFSFIDGRLLGSSNQYANLSMLFVSSEHRRNGAGGLLFAKASDNAKNLGAKKLFISAVAAEDVIAFYRKMGCHDAREIIDEFIDAQDDWPLEYEL